MAAVRHGTCVSPGIVFDHFIVRLPTDVMAITSLPKTAKQNSKGNRRPDDWLGTHFQVSGLSHQEPGSGDQVQVQVQEIRPLSSI